MAMESPALAEALLAYSSGHLSSSDPSHTVVALKARSNALSALSKAISSAADDISTLETTTAACLVLLTSEVCAGNHAGWYKHLVGAKHIITSAQSASSAGVVPTSHGTEAFKSSPGGQWVLRNFAYHDIIGSVTLGTKPLISGRYLQGITDVVDTYLGVGSGILFSISEISCLDATTTTTESTSSFPQRYSEIERTLQGWRCLDGTAPALAAVAHAYRTAGLIYLYRRVRRFLKPNTNPSLLSLALPGETSESLSMKIRREASNTLDHVAEVPLDDIAESALLFPLFMAGGEATNASQIETVRTRLQMLFCKRRFRNITRASEVLELLWDARQGLLHSAHERHVDWEDVLSFQDEPLLLT